MGRSLVPFYLQLFATSNLLEIKRSKLPGETVAQTSDLSGSKPALKSVCILA